MNNKNGLTSKLLAVSVALAAAGTARGTESKSLMDTVFKAPIDQVIRINDDQSSITYRKNAYFVTQEERTANINGVDYTVPVTVTNRTPYVWENATKTLGFARISDLDPELTDTLLASAATGDQVLPHTGTTNTVTIVSTSGNGSSFESSEKTYNLMAVSSDNSLEGYPLTNMSGYMADETTLLTWSLSGGVAPFYAIFQKDGDNFILDKQTIPQYYCQPEMVVLGNKAVYISDGSSIVKYYENEKNKLQSICIVENASVQDMAFHNNKLFWISGKDLYREGSDTPFVNINVTFTALASDTTALWVGNVSGHTSSTTLSGEKIEYVGDAQKITSQKDTAGQLQLWALNKNNEFVHVN